MLCLEKFYQDTGYSRSLLSDILDVSEDTLRKYERSNTDRMRESTIRKIEDGVPKILESGVKVTPMHFGHNFAIVEWSDPMPHKMAMSRYEVAMFIRRRYLERSI